VKRADVALLAGESGRRKRVRVAGLDAGAAAGRLLAAAPPPAAPPQAKRAPRRE
jgi:hypothetical protein